MAGTMLCRGTYVEVVAHKRLRRVQAAARRLADENRRWRAFAERNIVEGWEYQDELIELGLAEMRLPEPGSEDAERWGEDEPLCYLRRKV